jgi:hypothetical protein
VKLAIHSSSILRELKPIYISSNKENTSVFEAKPFPQGRGMAVRDILLPHALASLRSSPRASHPAAFHVRISTAAGELYARLKDGLDKEAV